jgi:hypothetical protein
MTYEQMERTMAFILQRQATFEADFHRSIEALVHQQAKFVSDMMQIKDLGGELAKGQVRIQNAVAELAVSHKQLVGSQLQLAESLQTTEERLRAVLEMMERRYGGNGRGRKTESGVKP